MNNPIELINMIKNPKEFVNNYVKQNNNPMLNNLIQMAQKNDVQSLENFARNLFNEQGQSYDEIISKIKQ